MQRYRYRAGQGIGQVMFDVGSDNHLVLQVVDEIYDKFAASKMGIEETGQVIITLLP